MIYQVRHQKTIPIASPLCADLIVRRLAHPESAFTMNIIRPADADTAPGIAVPDVLLDIVQGQEIDAEPPGA